MLRGNKQNPPAAGTVVFKKYEKNRRLYDTSTSRYVNLDDLAAAIRQGKDVRVVDAQTGEDLTRVTLTQIITEDAKDQPAGLPLELLRHLIVASDHAGREFIMWYLKSAFDAYHKLQGALESGLHEVQSAAKSPLQMVRSFIQGSTSGKPAENEELQILRRRVEELEARLEHTQRPGTKPGVPRKAKSRHATRKSTKLVR